MVRERFSGVGCGRHGCPRRGCRHSLRPPPARHDRRNGRGVGGPGKPQGRGRARYPAHLRGAGGHHRQQRLPRNASRCRAHRRDHGETGPRCRNPLGHRAPRHRARNGLYFPRDLHARPGRQRRRGDQRPARRVRRPGRQRRHRQYQGLHRPRHGHRNRGRGGHQEPGNGHRATCGQLQGDRSRPGRDQPVEGGPLPRTLCPAAGRGIRFADQHDPDALPAGGGRPAAGAGGAGLCLPHRRSREVPRLAGAHHR